ncbi:MAG: hypothetical protein ACE5IC_03885 [Candidatus Brocadiales bacterium]
MNWLLIVAILGIIGGMLVFVAGFVGAAPFRALNIPPGATLTTAQITAVVRVLKTYLSWSLILFGMGGIIVVVAFCVLLFAVM